MKKKLIIGILSTALLVGGTTVALGATDNSEIKDLYTQMFNLQKQIVDKEATSGAITADQAKLMKDRIDQQAQFQSQAIDNGQSFGPGYGGMMGNGGNYPGIGNGGCGGGGCGSSTPPTPSTTSANF